MLRYWLIGLWLIGALGFSLLRSVNAPLPAASIKIIIELADEPAVVIYAATQQLHLPASTTAQVSRVQIARIEAAQQTLLAALKPFNATILYRTQRVYNGIAASVEARHLDAVRQLPGVKAVHPLITKSLDNWHSVPLIGAPQVWEAAGLTGEGVAIGIIDSGIDYLHADFGGTATGAAYAANNTTVITDTYNDQLLYPTAKVVGGWDFVGDDYVGGGGGSPASLPSNLPQPDPDPAPCYGNFNTANHGTHVAGTAAGFGVNADGSTYTGAYSTSLNFSDFKVGPGVAPQALLYSLRVFGCSGDSDIVDQAIEWAVDPNGDGDFSDHLDVINMSLGSPYGAEEDSTAVAANNATLAGVIVVAAAGNNGDAYYIVNTPGSAARAISVAGSDDGAVTLDGFRVISPASSAGIYGGSQSTLYNWLTTTLPITGQLVYPEIGNNPAQDQRTGCYTFNVTNTQIISGNIALLDWTEPSCGGSVARVGTAATASARGVLLVDNLDLFHLIISGGPLLPAYSVPQEVGDMLKATLAVTEIHVVLTAEYQGSVKYVEPLGEDTIYTSSARGPRRGDSLLKPDLAAPGATIYSALNHSGTGGYALSGTSMASPHVAGTMALLRQLHPAWSVADLKALAMNTATTDITLGTQKYDPGRVGAGRVTLRNAVTSPAIAYNAEDPQLVSVSFGVIEATNTLSLTRPIHVTNKSAEAVAYAIEYTGYAEVPGVSYTLAPTSVLLLPYSSTDISLTLHAAAAQMKHTHAPTVPGDGGRSWLSEAAGYVVLTPFLPTYTVNVGTRGNGTGTVTRTPGGPTYTYSMPITLTATPGLGSQFIEWSGDATGSANPLSLTVDTDKNITATFSLNTYRLDTFSAGTGSGSITRNPDQSAYAYGTVVTLTATAAPAAYFSGWSGAATGNANPLKITIDGETALTATFSTRTIFLPLLIGGNSGLSAARPADRSATPRASTPLRVPIYAALRLASEMQATPSILDFTSITTTNLVLSGQGLNTGTSYPTDTLSLVSAFELAEISPVTTTPHSAADLHYLGAANNFSATGVVTATTLFFGVAAYGNWSMPLAPEMQFKIFIDTDRNGSDDFVLTNDTLNGLANDVFYSRLIKLSNNASSYPLPVNYLSADAYNTALFNTNLLILAVPANSIGLTTANPRFNYRVETYAGGLVIDASITHTYSAATAGLEFGNGLLNDSIWADLPGATIPIEFNAAAYAANGSIGVLLGHHHNASNDRTQVIAVLTP
jgi:subtilisin family serine protease